MIEIDRESIQIEKIMIA